MNQCTCTTGSGRRKKSYSREEAARFVASYWTVVGGAKRWAYQCDSGMWHTTKLPPHRWPRNKSSQNADTSPSVC